MQWRHPTCAAAILAGFGVWLCASAASSQGDGAKYPKYILIIRHGEKTGDAADAKLSAQGKQRAEALHQLFAASKNRPDPFPTPDFIFAASNSKSSHRPVDTVTPLGAKLKLSINHMFESKLLPNKDGKDDEFTGLRDEIFGQAKYAGKTILVAWRHGSIPALARTLKAGKVPDPWDDNVFDRVWQISFDDQGRATFVDRPQRLLPGDADK